MGEYIAQILLLVGVGSLLYQWTQQQKNTQNRVEAFVLFLQKSFYAMEHEKIRLIPYLMEYESGEAIITAFLQELAKRLNANQYPSGEVVWKEVLIEQKDMWKCNEETFGLLLNAGRGFFGRSRKENLCFLKKSIRELELQLAKNKEKDIQQQKVWLPVGILGSLMFIIILA